MAVSSDDEPKSALHFRVLLELLDAHFLAFPASSSDKSLACMPDLKQQRFFFIYLTYAPGQGSTY